MDPAQFPENPTEAENKSFYCGVCDRRFWGKTDEEAQELHDNHFAYTHPVDNDQGTI